MTRPDRSTPWTVAVFCDATEHDPAARPRVTTARHDGGFNSEWDLQGAELHVIGPDGERVDRRHWDPLHRELAARSGARRLRVVFRCRACGRPVQLSEGRSVFEALDDVRHSRKRSVKLSALVALAHEVRGVYWTDDA